MSSHRHRVTDREDTGVHFGRLEPNDPNVATLLDRTNRDENPVDAVTGLDLCEALRRCHGFSLHVLGGLSSLSEHAICDDPMVACEPRST